MKKAKFLLLLGVCSSLLLTGCLGSKSLDQEVKVTIETGFVPIVSNTGNSSFSANHTSDEYTQWFIEGMKNTFKYKKVVVDNSSPSYKIKIDNLTISESTEKKSVKDSTSKDFGKEYELTTISTKAEGVIIKMSTGEKVGSWSADKSKSEKLTSMQNAGQIVKGENKDLKDYREKDFDENEVLRISSSLGSRSADKIVKELARLIK